MTASRLQWSEGEKISRQCEEDDDDDGARALARDVFFALEREAEVVMVEESVEKKCESQIQRFEEVSRKGTRGRGEREKSC